MQHGAKIIQDMAVSSQFKNIQEPSCQHREIFFLGLNGLIDKLGEAMSTTPVFTIHFSAEARVYADYDWPLTEQARHGTAR